MLKYYDIITKKIALNRYNFIVGSVLKMKEHYLNVPNDDLKKELLSYKNNDFKEYIKALAIISQLSQNFFSLRPFKSQLQGSLVLNDGYIAEMKTGEGKTLVAVISLILNFLSEKNAHIVTANEYLVKRDYDFSKPLFEFLGITSSFLDSQDTLEEKQKYYKADVVYSTSKNLVFDYLNNNKFTRKEMLLKEQRDFVIVDEIDFVLIDEARTPIVLNGQLETDTQLFTDLQEIQKDFIGSHKIKDEDNDDKDPDFHYTSNMLELTEKGYNLLEKKLIEKGLINSDFSLYHGEGFKYIKSFEKTLKVNYLFKKDVDYMVLDGVVVIINQQTGRPQFGQRFSDGMHQAFEAKENVKINSNSQTFAQTTLQNYFKKYTKLSGMTGTALTDEAEFKEFYHIRVLPIETNKPLKRIDSNDLLYLNKKAMRKSLLVDLKDNMETGRPTLIGVQSVLESEQIATLLREENIMFEVLDAKNHEREAYVIEQAGKPSSVTIATNMAGRGTDIMLGGNKDIVIKEYNEKNPSSTYEEGLEFWNKEHDKVINSGGLSILGVGRNDSRRLDNQLIGRSGRQGDPGMTKFYLTLDDSLFKNIATGYLRGQWKKESEDTAISAGIISRVIRESQKTYESNGFNMRKNLLKFDNINTEQREIFYAWRRKVVVSENLDSVVEHYFKDSIDNILNMNKTRDTFLSNDLNAIENDFLKFLTIEISIRDICEKENIADQETFSEFIYNSVINDYKEKAKLIDKKEMNILEKNLLLGVMDANWTENISSLEEMRINTSLRVYAQKNPLDEYQKEALLMFKNLVDDVKRDLCLGLMRFSPLALLEQKEQYETLEKERQLNLSNQNKNNINIDMSTIGFLPEPVKGIGI